MVRIFLFLILACSQPLLAMHRSTERASLGVRTIDYLDASRNRPVVIELWYPTAALQPIDPPSDSIWVHPQEVRNAPLLKGKAKYPLILISHGHRGGRREASWLAVSLVQAGYMVAAVDHYGDMRFHSDILESIRFWNRPLDFTFVLDQLEKDGALQAEIDFDRIGFIGYSMGGMTGLALAGGQAQNGRVRQAALKVTQSALYEKLIDRFDLSPAAKSYKEPRIKAMVLLCPAVFVYAPDTLRQIKTPIGLVAAVGDEVLPFKEHAYQIIHHLVPKKVKMLREEISHYAFLNPITDSGKLILHKALQNDPPCCGRDALHREVTAFAIEFFQGALKKR